VQLHYPDDDGGDIEIAVTLGPVVKLSLRTRDPETAKRRTALIAGQLHQLTRAVTDGPKPLSHKQAVALAGDIYRWMVSEWEDDPGTTEQWTITPRVIGGMTAAELAALLDPLIGRFLDRRGVVVAQESMPVLRKAVADAVVDASKLMAQRAEGDYRPDAVVARFPEWHDAEPKAGAGTITSLADGWRAEAERLGRSPSTTQGYDKTLRKFVAFIGHDDAGRVTAVDVLRFKDHRLLVEKRDPKTVQAADLVALKAVFGWGVENRRIAANPAEGIRVKQPKKARRQGYTEVEATRLLKAALAYERLPNETAKTAAAKRWIPLLMAFTGCRVGEAAQLRRNDLRKDDAAWVLTISPEAGTVKTQEARDVPLHPQLAQLGFIEFVQSMPAGYLFLSATGRDDYRGPWRGIKNRIGEFARGIVRRDGLAPCHGWRHHFITRAREHGVDAEKRRQITGHRGHGVDETTYGKPAGLYREICKLPAYEL
jgi:integrase